jgi:hypothetical protein
MMTDQLTGNGDCWGLRLHAYIEVNIKLPETRRSPIRVMARVMRKLEDTVCVGWCNFEPSTVKDLLRPPSIQLPP